MLAAEQMIEDEQMQMTTTTRRQQSSLFGALQTEFKRATSPQPRQKKLASDLSDLPTEYRIKINFGTDNPFTNTFQSPHRGFRGDCRETHVQDYSFPSSSQ